MNPSCFNIRQKHERSRPRSKCATRASRAMSTNEYRGWTNVAIVRRAPNACDELEDHAVAQEVPVEIHLNQQTAVVTMASPVDLADLAVGFLVGERYLDREATIERVEVFDKPVGFVVNVMAQTAPSLRIKERSVVARSSCGLCGVTSLDDALSELPAVTSQPLPTSSAIHAALGRLREAQALNQRTRAVHGAAWCDVKGNIVAVREDIGRHNALDKLLGARARASDTSAGFVLLTSRVSYELVQKAAMSNVATLAAISAPTTLALDIAHSLGINIIAIARDDNHSVFLADDKKNWAARGIRRAGLQHRRHFGDGDLSLFCVERFCKWHQPYKIRNSPGSSQCASLQSSVSGSVSSGVNV